MAARDPSMPSILLVSATFPPSLLIGGRRVARMATGLHAQGWQVTVLTVLPQYMVPWDPAEAPPAGVEVIATHVLSPRAWVRQVRRVARKETVGTASPALVTAGWRHAVVTGVRKVLNQIEFPDEYAGWQPLATRAVRGRRFDVVLGSMPPFTDALVARTLAHEMGARLVLDYRDPWSEWLSEDGSYGHDFPVPRALIDRHRKLENGILAEADLILGTSPRLCGWLQARTARRVLLLPNGLDHAPPATPAPRVTPLRLVYAGSLSYSRSLGGVLAALEILRGEFGPEALRLVYAGAQGKQLLAAAEAAGVADYLDDLGTLPRREVLKLYQGAAAGIAAVSARMNYCYPGKLFEILASGCRVLMVGPDDADACLLVGELGVGVADDGSDPKRTAACLREVLGDAAPLPPLDEWVAEAQMRRLDGELRGIVG